MLLQNVKVEFGAGERGGSETPTIDWSLCRLRGRGYLDDGEDR